MPGEITRATLGRLPVYLRFLQNVTDQQTISATALAHALGLGEVQVRKDLAAVSGAGKPKIGYYVGDLTAALESILHAGQTSAVLIGAGRLGRALLDYGGFKEYGLDICAAFDIAVNAPCQSDSGKKIYPLSALETYCRGQEIAIGILCVPASAAEETANLLVKCHIRAIWNFAPCTLNVPENISVRQENLALSLAYLRQNLLK